MRKKTLVFTLTALILCMGLSAYNHNLAKGAEKSNVRVSGSAQKTKSPMSNYKISNIPTLTMDKASEVNTVTHLLEKYKTVTYAQLDYIGGITMHVTYFKDKNKNCCCVEDDFDYSGYRTDGIDFSREKGKTTYSLSATKNLNVSNYLLMVPGGKFTSQTTDESGNLVCEAEADISKEYADQLSKSWPVTTKDKMVTTTVFAADDDRVLSIDFTIRRTDGSELKIASGVLLYNEKVSYTDAVKDYLETSKFNVTVIMADGSVRTAQIPKGKRFTWDCDDGYALYTDKKGKNPIPKKTEPVKGNLTLYCLKKK